MCSPVSSNLRKTFVFCWVTFSDISVLSVMPRRPRSLQSLHVVAPGRFTLIIIIHYTFYIVHSRTPVWSLSCLGALAVYMFSFPLTFLFYSCGGTRAVYMFSFPLTCQSFQCFTKVRIPALNKGFFKINKFFLTMLWFSFVFSTFSPKRTYSSK